MTHAAVIDPRSIPTARTAISYIFLLNGVGIGLWTAHVPIVQERMGIDLRMMSVVLLAIAAGVLLAMPLTGRLIGRWGTRNTVLLSGVAFVLMTPVILNMPNLPMLFVAAFLFGLASGALAVAMNVNATQFEAARGLPTMSSFYGCLSLGGLLGAGLGWYLIEEDLAYGDGALMVGTGMILLLGGLASEVKDFAASDEKGSHTGSPFWRRYGAVLGLGVLALLCIAVERTVDSWSGLLLLERTGVRRSTAVLGHWPFTMAIVVSRFAGDRIILRYGAMRVMVASGLVMFAGLALAAWSTHVVVLGCGFALVGLGAANVVPLLVGASSRLPGISAGSGVATVAMLAYGSDLLAAMLLALVATYSGTAVVLGALSLAGLVIAASAGVLKQHASLLGQYR